MILFFTNSLIKKTQEVNVSLGDFNQEEEKQNFNAVLAMAPGPVPASSPSNPDSSHSAQPATWRRSI